MTPTQLRAIAHNARACGLVAVDLMVKQKPTKRERRIKRLHVGEGLSGAIVAIPQRGRVHIRVKTPDLIRFVDGDETDG